MIKPIPTFNGDWDNQQNIHDYCHQLDGVIESIEEWSAIVRSMKLSIPAEMARNGLIESLDALVPSIGETIKAFLKEEPEDINRGKIGNLLHTCEMKHGRVVWAFKVLENATNTKADLWKNGYYAKDQVVVKKLTLTDEMWTDEEAMAAFGHRLMEAGESILSLFNEFKDIECEDNDEGISRLAYMVTLQEMNHITTALYDGLGLSDFDVLSTKASVKLFNHKVDLLDILSSN